MSRKHAARRLSLEQLEHRELMAGDLHAALVEGDLIISGGPLSNGLQITAGPAAGTVSVDGLRQAGFPTQINHQNGPLTFAVANDVVIDLGDGDNLIKIENVCLPGKLKVLTGEGGDTFDLVGSTVRRSLIVDTGAGNDHVVLSNDTIQGRLEAKLRFGDDYFAVLGSRVRGDAELDAGWNADRVNVQDSYFDAGLSIRSEANFAPKRVTLANVHVGDCLSVDPSDGDDVVLLSSVSANEIEIATGEAADRVELDWVTADHLRIALGAGHDELSVGNSVARAASFEGGPGTNAYDQPNPNRFSVLELSQFDV
jgi:hypothetical protein